MLKQKFQENLIKQNTQGDIQIQAEEFKGEAISALHFKDREEQPQVFKQSTLIYPVTLQEQLPNDSYLPRCARTEWTLVEMLQLRK